MTCYNSGPKGVGSSNSLSPNNTFKINNLNFRIAEELNGAATRIGQQGESIENLTGLLPTTKTCRVCQARGEAQRRGVEDVANSAGLALERDPHVPACCLPHLLLVIGSVGPGQAAQKLLEAHGCSKELPRICNGMPSSMMT